MNLKTRVVLTSVGLTASACGRAPQELPRPATVEPPVEVTHQQVGPSGPAPITPDDGAQAKVGATPVAYGPKGELLNQGTLCLFQGKPDDRNSAARVAFGHLSTDLTDGENLYVGVSPLRSAGCASVTAHTCVVEREANALRVSSSLAYKSADRPCVAESGGGHGEQAFCRVPKLAPGHYTLHWGSRSLSVDVPSKVVTLSRCLYEESNRQGSSTGH